MAGSTTSTEKRVSGAPGDERSSRELDIKDKKSSTLKSFMRFNSNVSEKSKDAPQSASEQSNQDDDNDEGCDQRRLSSALQDAVRYSNGVSAVEVWLFDTTQGRLVMPDGGWWRDPAFVPESQEALERIEDSTRSDFVAANPLLPGIGLAGGLWAEVERTVPHRNLLSQPSKRNDLDEEESEESDDDDRPTLGQGKSLRTNAMATMTGGSFRRSAMMSHKEFNKSADKDFRRGLNFKGLLEHTQTYNALTWRDLQSMLVDPDRPTFPRLVLMGEAGFGKAAGVTFEAPHNQKGIIVYLAGNDTPAGRLTVKSNDMYLRSAAHVIGAVAALAKPRIDSVASRDDSNLRRLGLGAAQKHVSTRRMSLKENADRNCLMHGAHRATIWGRKSAGGGLQPPPPMPLSQASLAFFGTFVTLLLLGWLSERLRYMTDGKHSLVLGPFGALMMLQYGLVMAPASQPRSILLGHTISFCVSLLFSYIPKSSLPVSVRVAMSVASVVALMAKLGITHPPAAANATILASGKFSWLDLPFLLLGNAVAIVTAIAINNLSDKRQYPTFWHLGVGGFVNMMKKLMPSPTTLSKADHGDESDSIEEV